MESSLQNRIERLRTIKRSHSCPDFYDSDAHENTADLQPTEMARCDVQAEGKVNSYFVCPI